MWTNWVSNLGSLALESDTTNDCTTQPYQHWIYSYRKGLALRGAKHFFYELTPFSKGNKTENLRFAYPEYFLIHLKVVGQTQPRNHIQA